MKFLEIVNPTQGQNKGNVENWLSEVEDQMRLCLEDIMNKALIDYGACRRSNIRAMFYVNY